MDDKTMNFNETQLKRVGMAEAFTAELKKKMEEGAPTIQHGFKKEYDGDKVEATLHLKRSTTSDHYFLNKFDLSLQKQGQGEINQQTFYVNYNKNLPEKEGDGKQQVDNKYTLKEAYNLLAGRPVYKNLVSKEGNQYEAWIKLDVKNKLDNGNHQIQQYTRGYGFDLKSTLLQYSIAEMRNDTYTQRLTDSLQRGNLQKVTFVANDGKEEKLYISPNIKLGALDVYDQNKKRVSLESLIGKNYISEKLANQVKQRIDASQKKELAQDNCVPKEKQQKENISQQQRQSKIQRAKH